MIRTALVVAIVALATVVAFSSPFVPGSVGSMVPAPFVPGSGGSMVPASSGAGSGPPPPPGGGIIISTTIATGSTELF